MEVKAGVCLNAAANGALMARMRLCLILRHGASPPGTPCPLCLVIKISERRGNVKGSQAAQKARALDMSSPF